MILALQLPLGSGPPLHNANCRHLQMIGLIGPCHNSAEVADLVSESGVVEVLFQRYGDRPLGSFLAPCAARGLDDV